MSPIRNQGWQEVQRIGGHDRRDETHQQEILSGSCNGNSSERYLNDRYSMVRVFPCNEDEIRVNRAVVSRKGMAGSVDTTSCLHAHYLFD